MKWIIRVYSIILLSYSGWRTYDFMSSQLPKGDVSFWLSIVFLFATEAGLLLWHEAALSHVTTETQERIAKTMTGVDFIGGTAAGIADMIIRQTMIAYQIPPMLAQFLIYGLPVIVAANVGAVLFYLWFDGDQMIEREKRQARFEIYDQALRDVRAARKEIARDKKTQIYSQLRAEITGEIDRRYGGKPAGEGSTEVVTPTKNGKTPEANFTHQQRGN